MYISLGHCLRLCEVASCSQQEKQIYRKTPEFFDNSAGLITATSLILVETPFQLSGLLDCAPKKKKKLFHSVHM